MVEIQKADGTIENVTLVTYLISHDGLSQYIIYTKNEKDFSGNTIIYSGKVKVLDGKQFLENIDEGVEWEKLKSIMKAMAKYSLDGESYV